MPGFPEVGLQTEMGAKQKRLCYCCLSKNHQAKNCKKSRQCNADGCNGKHHSLLHHEQQQAAEQGKDDQQVEKNADKTFSSLLERNSEVSLRTVPVVVRHNGRKLSLVAMLNEGSIQCEVTFLIKKSNWKTVMHSQTQPQPRFLWF